MAQARELGVNVSQAAEGGIAAAVARRLLGREVLKADTIVNALDCLFHGI